MYGRGHTALHARARAHVAFSSCTSTSYTWRSNMASKRKAPASMKLTKFFSQPGTSSATSTEDKSDAEDPVSIAKRAKHRTTFNPAWNDEFAWLLYKPEEGMFCKLCQKYNKSTKRMVFITSPCVLFRKDKLHEHQKTQGHADSVIAESHAVAAKCSGGFRAVIYRSTGFS